MKNVNTTKMLIDYDFSEKPKYRFSKFLNILDKVN